jgi:hypothetical protein
LISEISGSEATILERGSRFCRGLGALSRHEMKKMDKKFGTCEKTPYLCSVKNKKSTQNVQKKQIQNQTKKLKTV